MKKTIAVFRVFLWILSLMICGWFLTYFFWGNRFNIEFTERCWAYTFTEILVFATAASIYLMFILLMKQNAKWWKNLMLFLVGLLLSIIPIVVYHGFFKFENEFYNEQRLSSTIISVNKFNKTQKVEIRKNYLIPHKKFTTDTVTTHSLTPYLQIVHPISNTTLKNGNWISTQ